LGGVKTEQKIEELLQEWYRVGYLPDDFDGLRNLEWRVNKDVFTDSFL